MVLILLICVYYLICFQSFPVAASTLSLVAIAADRCSAIRRGRDSAICARPFLAVAAVWIMALLLGKFEFSTTTT